MTVSVLIQETGIPKTTLYRELDFLESQDWLIWERGKGVSVKEKQNFLPEKGFTHEEILSLSVAVPILEAQALQGAVQAIEKMTQSLPTALQTILNEAHQSVISGNRSRQQREERYLIQLLGAIRQRQTVRLDYDSASSGRSFRRFDPYAIDLSATKVAIHCWCHNHQKFLTVLLRRIEGLEMKGDRFTRRDGEWEAFRRQSGVVGGLRGGKPIPVRIRFSPSVTRYVNEASWPAGLKREPQDNGGVLVSGTVQGVEGILVEVLRWRRHATVEGGEELKEALREELRAIQANYDRES